MRGQAFGRVRALSFSGEGAKVVVADSAVTGGEETLRLIKTATGEDVFVPGDVLKAADVQALMAVSVKTYGR